eukprot:CAMPEP_0172454230 /NCGR_PEP_ID=MMETSP1065-20121228/11286_1 /TAXON_ID=265537 /ORGANISM="Amphiprora paludosa, Strain CCMP125" /LENGTH=51 /DNA_ID=CAMNT_0013206523 /DNA_START=114 /DNA_END=266 /DNA_ORIENTATION=-
MRSFLVGSLLVTMGIALAAEPTDTCPFPGDSNLPPLECFHGGTCFDAHEMW